MLRAQKAGTAAKDPMKALRRLLSITFGDRKGHFAVILLCIIVSSIAIVFSASFLGTLVDSFIVPVIGVEDPDPITHVAQCEGQIGRDCRFSHTSFAGSNGENFTDSARLRMAFGRLLCMRCRLFDEDRNAFFVERQLLGEYLLNLMFDFQCEGIAGFVEAQRDNDFLILEIHTLHDTAFEDIASAFGMNDRRKQLFDLLQQEQCLLQR